MLPPGIQREYDAAHQRTGQTPALSLAYQRIRMLLERGPAFTETAMQIEPDRIVCMGQFSASPGTNSARFTEYDETVLVRVRP